MNVEQIALVCHAANAAYCESIGDYSQPSWAESPDWQKNSARNGVEMHLRTLAQGKEPNPAESHQAWYAQKEREGWQYGPEKNPDTKQHPCFVPYDQLPADQKVKDFIFVNVVKAFFAASKQHESQAA